jgi:hypothetical protein
MGRWSIHRNSGRSEVEISDRKCCEDHRMTELAKWANFYVIVGSAAGALIGLQFVALTLIANRPHGASPEAGAAFGSPTIVHLSSALFLSAISNVPWPIIGAVAVIWGILGLGGIAYSVVVARRMRKQSAYEPQFEDWLFHCFLPLVAYAAVAFASLAAPAHEALFSVGGGALLLLFIGIHNAWDGVSYHVLVTVVNAEKERRKDEIERKGKEPE